MRKTAPVFLVLLVTLAGCSKSPAPASEPTSGSAVLEGGPSDEPSANLDEEAATAEPAGPDCSDGTCFACGEGVCPQGAYCDQGAPGGAACAWIQECPGQPACSCLLKVFGRSCSCSVAAGGPSVSCP